MSGGVRGDGVTFYHSTRVIRAGLLLLALCLASVSAARGQVIRSRRGQGQRVGRVVLPTPPFNPDAGILSGPRAGGKSSPKAGARRPAGRKARAKSRKPRAGTPGRPRARRGRRR
jgi:hypothetical protein